MIQLLFQPKPAQLTDDVVAELTEEFKKTGKDVWKKSYIAESLLKMSFGKCCFCETKIDEESKYMEVEHFHPKSLYPDEVVDWDNLLPICKRCNSKKSDHDTKKKQESIIHPVHNNPKTHLRLENYRFYGITELGKCTKDVIYLNDRKKLVDVRYKIGTEISESLEKLADEINTYINSPSTRRKNKIVGNFKNIMLEGTKEYEYSATTATTILKNPNYSEIKQLFVTHQLWDDEFKKLEQQVTYCALI